MSEISIVFLISDYSLGRGGERVTIGLANELVNYYKVTILSLYQKNEQPIYLPDSRIIIKTINKGEQIQSKFVKGFQKIKELLHVIKALNKLDAQIFIGVATYCSILLGALRWLNRKKKYIGWEHSSYNAATGKWIRLRNRFFKKLDAVVCLNPAEQRHYQQQFVNVVCIPNIVSFRSAVKATLINKEVLAIGALETEKGFDLLITAFNKFDVAGEWKLRIIGDGSKRKELEVMVQQLGLNDRVSIDHFTKQIIHAYLNAGMYVLSSRREGLPGALIEAMECGLPCVAFDCPTGPAYIIKHNENGLLVPAGDTDKLSGAMRALADDRQMAERFVTNGTASLHQFSPEAIVPLWQKLVNNFLL